MRGWSCLRSTSQWRVSSCHWNAWHDTKFRTPPFKWSVIVHRIALMLRISVATGVQCQLTIRSLVVTNCTARFNTKTPALIPYYSYNVQQLSSCTAWTLWFLGAFAKLRKTTVSSVVYLLFPSFRRHETTRLPLDRFSWNSISDHFSKNFKFH